MKILLGIIGLIMCMLIGNIIAYTVSEDYRFFLKKIKYREQVVYENDDIIGSEIYERNDDEDVQILKNEILGRENIEENTSGEEYTFVDVLSGRSQNAEAAQTSSIPELTWTQEKFLEVFDDYVLEELVTPWSLFGITTEYPDPYFEYYSSDLSVYVFPTKTYSEVRKIFDVLSYELPYTINEVNNFWQASFYINLENAYRDNTVRLILKHKNKAFWLKIKKDSYNAIKKLLEDNFWESL